MLDTLGNQTDEYPKYIAPPLNNPIPIQEPNFIKTELFDPNYSIPVDDPNEDVLIKEPVVNQKLKLEIPQDIFDLLMYEVYSDGKCLEVVNINGELRIVLDVNVSDEIREPHHIFNPQKPKWQCPTILIDAANFNGLSILYMPIIKNDQHTKLHQIFRDSQFKFNRINNLFSYAHIKFLTDNLELLRGKISKREYNALVYTKESLNNLNYSPLLYPELEM